MQTPPYKDKMGRWRTQSLFVEVLEQLGRTPDETPPFSLRGREGFIDAKQTFLNERDPTGYKWATRYLGSYDHLKRLMTSAWFQDIYNDWLSELHILMQSEAIDRIREIAETGQPTQALAASKYIAERGWESKTAPKRGRPSKDEVKGALKEAIRLTEEEEEDFKRVGLSVIEGGKKG